MADVARQAELSVSFDGVDISMTVNKYLMSLNYTDNEEDDADDLQIKLQDRDGTWLQTWLNDTIQSAANAYSGQGEALQTQTVNDNRQGLRGTISKGTSTYDAMVCQIYLEALGYLTTGILTKADDDTVKAIKAFQKANDLGDSGKCDKKMWKKLTAQVQGLAITKYDCVFKAASNVAVRVSANGNAKKIATIAKGETCVVTDHVSSSWFTVEYNGQTGYSKGGDLKANTARKSTAKVPDSKTKGLGIRASIACISPDGTRTVTDCGLFELDDIKASGPPATVTIKATSLGYSGIRKTENDKSWENYTLKRIAEEIGGKVGLGVLFECDVDPKYERIEQSKQTDIALLKKLCQNCGYSLKIADNRIIIFDQKKYEAQEEIASITFGDGSYTKWSLATGEGEVEYAACRVNYTDPATGKTIKGEAHSENYKPDDEKNEILVVTDQKVSNADEAKELAEKLLKLNNKLEREATITVPGNPIYAAGMTVRLHNFGYWSGKYLISKAKHDVSTSGYTTTITLRKVDEVEAPKAEEEKPKKEEVKKTEFEVGDIVTFKGGYHYESSDRKKPTGGYRRGGIAKVTHKTKLTARHPYGLQGGYYNSLDGDCNVHGWVDKDSFY